MRFFGSIFGRGKKAKANSAFEEWKAAQIEAGANEAVAREAIARTAEVTDLDAHLGLINDAITPEGLNFTVSVGGNYELKFTGDDADLDMMFFASSYYLQADRDYEFNNVKLKINSLAKTAVIELEDGASKADLEEFLAELNTRFMHFSLAPHYQLTARDVSAIIDCYEEQKVFDSKEDKAMHFPAISSSTALQAEGVNNPEVRKMQFSAIFDERAATLEDGAVNNLQDILNALDGDMGGVPSYRVMLPYQINNSHWCLLVVDIAKQAGRYKVQTSLVDPFAETTRLEGDMKTALEEKLREGVAFCKGGDAASAPVDFSYEEYTATEKPPRIQADGDGYACGAIVAKMVSVLAKKEHRGKSIAQTFLDEAKILDRDTNSEELNKRAGKVVPYGFNAARLRDSQILMLINRCKEYGKLAGREELFYSEVVRV